MPQLTNKEIAKVFAMYYGCKVRYDKSVSELTNTGVTIDNVLKNGLEWKKLLLTPLQSISDEDAIVVARIFKFTNASQHKQLGKSLIYQLYTLKEYDFDIQNEDAISIFQYLRNRGYDLPLYFEPAHWANGHTPIQLNLAISKTN